MLTRPTLDAGRAINGSFGYLYDENGNQILECRKFSAKDTLNWQEMQLCGTRRTKHKLTSQKGEGSMTIVKITSDLAAKLLADPTRSFAFVGELDDPEAYGYERVRYRGVKFNEINLTNYEAGQVIEEEWTFVFDDDPELLDAVIQFGASAASTVSFTA